jgi:hypothetical protein
MANKPSTIPSNHGDNQGRLATFRWPARRVYTAKTRMGWSTSRIVPTRYWTGMGLCKCRRACPGFPDSDVVGSDAPMVMGWLDGC